MTGRLILPKYWMLDSMLRLLLVLYPEQSYPGLFLRSWNGAVTGTVWPSCCWSLRWIVYGESAHSKGILTHRVPSLSSVYRLLRQISYRACVRLPLPSRVNTVDILHASGGVLHRFGVMEHSSSGDIFIFCTGDIIVGHPR